MTSHSYEIAYWIPSQAVLDDQISISEPCLELMKTKTPLPILTGVSVEDKLFFVVVAWDKTETHKAVAESPDFPKILKAFAPLFPDPRPSSGITMVHAHFAPGRDPLPILSAPLTAVTYLVPKEGVSKEELGKALDGVCEAAKVKVVEKGLGFGVTWARIEERDGEEGWQLLIVSGWKTMQDHIDFGSGDPAVAEMQSKLQLDKCITAHIPFAKRQWI